MQSVKLLILFGLWLSSMAAFFFLAFPFRGEVLGISIAVVYLVLIYALLDKWFLLFFFASPVQRGDKLYEKFQNIAYGYNVRDVGFYYSRLGIDNVAALEWAGRKVLIFDRDLRDSPYAEKCLEDVLEAFRSGKIKSNRGLVFMFAVYNLPLVVLEKFFGRFWIYSLVSSLWLTPFKLLAESCESKKQSKTFLSYEDSSINSLDSFTSELTRITGIYKTTGDDLMSMVFNRDNT